MKNTVTLIAAFLAGLSPAMAQDWDGWFAGFDAGVIQSSASDGTVSTSHARGSAGLVVGHWWPSYPLLLGAEAGLSAGLSKRSIHVDLGAGWTPWTFQHWETVSPSARVMAGSSFGDTLVYAAIGAELHNSASHRVLSGGSIVDRKSSSSLQGLLAIGAERYINEEWRVRAEVQTRIVDASPGIRASNVGVKLGLLYHFN